MRFNGAEVRVGDLVSFTVRGSALQNYEGAVVALDQDFIQVMNPLLVKPPYAVLFEAHKVIHIRVTRPGAEAVPAISDFRKGEEIETRYNGAPERARVIAACENLLAIQIGDDVVIGTREELVSGTEVA